MTIEVIWGSGSPYAWRVLLTLEVKGLSYESRLIQFSRGDHRSPEHLALNPRGKVPVLRDGDYVLSESLAIMAYLDRKHPEPPLSAVLRRRRGLIWKAISEFECYVWPPAERIVVPAFGIRPLDPADVQAAAGELQGELGLMEEAMSKRDWLAVEQPRRPRRLEAPEWMRVTICCREERQVAGRARAFLGAVRHGEREGAADPRAVGRLLPEPRSLRGQAGGHRSRAVGGDVFRWHGPRLRPAYLPSWHR